MNHVQRLREAAEAGLKLLERERQLRAERESNQARLQAEREADLERRRQERLRRERERAVAILDEAYGTMRLKRALRKVVRLCPSAYANWSFQDELRGRWLLKTVERIRAGRVAR